MRHSSTVSEEIEVLIVGAAFHRSDKTITKKQLKGEDYLQCWNEVTQDEQAKSGRREKPYQ